MPMQVTVSRNRKTSHNYNSEGFGVSVTVELDQTLLTRPADLQRQLDALYREADEALERQASGQTAPASTEHASGAQTDATARYAPRGNGHNGNGRNGRRSSGAGGGGTMTASQRRAIEGIGRRLGLDVVAECRDEFGEELDNLDVRGASKLIDHLKALQASSNGKAPGNAPGNGARR